MPSHSTRMSFSPLTIATLSTRCRDSQFCSCSLPLKWHVMKDEWDKLVLMLSPDAAVNSPRSRFATAGSIFALLWSVARPCLNMEKGNASRLCFWSLSVPQSSRGRFTEAFRSCHAEDFISYAPCISGPLFEFARKQKQKQSLHPGLFIGKRCFSQQSLLTGMSLKATWTRRCDLSRHGLVPVPCSQVNQSLQLLL